MKRRPKTSIACPLCRERIGLVSGIKAPTPWTLRCPHCRTWLRVRMPGMILLVPAVVALIALCIASVPLARSVFGAGWSSLYLAALLGLWLLAEVGCTILFFTYATFTPIRFRNRLLR